MVSIHALYEKRQSDDRFDMEYLLQKRIPFVRQVLLPYGLVDIVVHQGLTPHGLVRPKFEGIFPPKFVCIIVLTFANLEDLLRGWDEQSERLNAGIVEFTNIKPLVQISEVS